MLSFVVSDFAKQLQMYSSADYKTDKKDYCLGNPGNDI